MGTDVTSRPVLILGNGVTGPPRGEASLAWSAGGDNIFRVGYS